MNNLQFSTIPKKVIKDAIRIIKKQVHTPYSPMEKTSDGRVIFCAAAALAIAGLEGKKMENRKEVFIKEALLTKSSESIKEIFKEFHWSVDLCNDTIAANDSFKPNNRTESVVQMFEEALV